MNYLELSSTEITRKSGSNLAFCFAFLPPPRKRGMTVYYAFCRVVDDIADDTATSLDEKKAQLEECRIEIDRCYEGRATTALGRDIQLLLHEFPTIPKDYFDELIKGVEMDLTIKRYGTFEDLRQYCYRVASVVGLTSIEIFGYRNHSAKQYAIDLGLAFQLTNILRDIKKDALNDRIYIPQEELTRFNYPESDLMAFKETPAFLELARFQCQRAEEYYAKAKSHLAPEDRRAMVAAESMRAVYHKILEKLATENFPVMRKDVSLCKWHKLWLITRTFLFCR
ncbi:presqualene diphosphate synthase HpnD [Kamptonema cortianum]|uniref:Presqualene diphosphate synthase HpnD n=1 Tax=Geitlerinema calcuttense NRMC-F 0142 TaxID=2922238 RepID=A0ABT7LX48_9CYAN|nr:presqualene diphosphate synthase HpnD [Geitlerinema calcuttense]MDK3156626.1 presqualene diphosphate synthase HpnD [Kamptonema cortianum]MDL5050364.1 presqualene diphosphate synthase HpnD [Oscillatoria amoena NRMC-F 0135]MDL5053365.1 presqualene diphosphate synthase HpnD [Oscillatoria laete-virens NRMC-F 0139]MDL5056584.1 presqualene diphosphate synthase HpnD [Geitlerinema calcuttense NRMC-F 0142]